ncbi:hypothetical protein [Saccharothrix algeriensis]|uniref:Uncharacterized protein n=1 Tax=Saccharothrix algeriensis TaxID=173560 RepID=A0A8T8I3D4_9PSEU|nr:hypothetical protein [Saccharothrix algeriensis]MBM7811340.1 hypothetical protein [Saccharothrix algeriensis]QTR05227.1 hypothetical protein J7S33_11380 [Saccharothrix algeriensis]
MAVRLSPVRWALVLLVVGLAGIAVAVALWLPGSRSAEVRRVEATVVTPASCGGPDAHDRVELTIGGQTRTAKLDGCGHRENEVVEVVVPADTNGDLVVQVADSAPVSTPLRTRLAAMLTCLSGLAGGLYAHLLARRAQPTASAEAA